MSVIFIQYFTVVKNFIRSSLLNDKCVGKKNDNMLKFNECNINDKNQILWFNIYNSRSIKFSIENT